MGSQQNNNDFMLFIVTIVVACISVLNDYDKYQDLSASARLRKLLYSLVGSGLTTWSVYELLLYFDLPSRLCLPLAGACGYLGAEVISRLIISFVEKKIQTKS